MLRRVPLVSKRLSALRLDHSSGGSPPEFGVSGLVERSSCRDAAGQGFCRLSYSSRMRPVACRRGFDRHARFMDRLQ